MQKLFQANLMFTGGNPDEDGTLMIGDDKITDKYLVLFFYPLDFTFVCPTEIIAFSDAVGQFEACDTRPRLLDRQWR